MAGLACGGTLGANGMEVTLFDKGRRRGGRMSTRRVATSAGEASFDHGAQYFTVRDAEFRAQVEAWQAMGVAAPWPAAGRHAWVGTPGMNAPVKQMAGALDVRWSMQVRALERDGARWRVEGNVFDAVIVAVPAEQTAPLLRPWQPAFAVQAARTRSMPCWTVMAAFAERLPIGADVLREDALQEDGSRGNGALGWAARNSAKPGRLGPESWVVQAGPEWSSAHLEEEASEVIAPLLQALDARAGVKLAAPLSAVAHRWRYARAGSAGVGAYGTRRCGLGHAEIGRSGRGWKPLGCRDGRLRTHYWRAESATEGDQEKIPRVSCRPTKVTSAPLLRMK